MKTDIELRDLIYYDLKKADFIKELSGKVYKGEGSKGRPVNSKKEDCLVSVLANVNGEIQEANVNVNLYVADVLLGTKEYVENTPRLRALSRKIADFYAAPKIIEGVHVRIEAQRIFASNANEHIINTKLLLNLYNS